MVRLDVRQALAIVSCFAIVPAAAQARSHHRHHRHELSHRHYAQAGHVIQCVAFAKADSGIELPGNAVNWWSNAAGRYARGNAPEVGSVLNFRANSRMRLGHVAVVAEVLNSRMVRIDQSHWNRNGVSRDVNVVDVSPDNDWSAVRVALSRGDTYGSIYPTYGFIYPRPDNGTMVAASSDAPAIDVGPAPARLRSLGRRHEVTMEVAEAPSARGIDLATPGLIGDAPNRNLQ
jgi:surface antigen